MPAARRRIRTRKNRPLPVTLIETNQGAPVLVPCDGRGRVPSNIIDAKTDSGIGGRPTLTVTYCLAKGSFRMIPTAPFFGR